MNSKLADIFKRRSIRKYKDEKIPLELVNDILKAGMAAPSAVNKKPYEIIVIDKNSLLKQVSEYLPNGGFLRNAPLGIIVCGDIKKAHGESLSYMLQDCTAVIENILLAVTTLDLGACWLGVHPMEDRINGIKEIFNLPENIIPVSAIAVGYPDGSIPEPRTQFDSEKVHINKW